MKEVAFKDLLKSIDEAREIHAGKLKASRVIHFKPVEIRLIRRRLHVTQRKLAYLFGISIATLRNWEQGRNYPDGPARVLLKIAAVRPDAIIEALRT